MKWLRSTSFMLERYQHFGRRRHDREVTVEQLLADAGWMRRLAQALVGDAGADDLVQDASEAALKHPPANDRRPHRPWLRRVMRNLAAMGARGAERRTRREAAV